MWAVNADTLIQLPNNGGVIAAGLTDHQRTKDGRVVVSDDTLIDVTGQGGWMSVQMLSPITLGDLDRSADGEGGGRSGDNVGGPGNNNIPPAGAGTTLPDLAQPNGPFPVQPTPPAQGPSPARSDSDVLREWLREVGLSDLYSQVRQWLTEGATDDEIYLRLRATQQYKDRFRGNEMLIAAGQAPISEGAYLAYERDAYALERFYGLPTGLVDPGTLIGQGVSMGELNDRVVKGFSLVDTAPAEVKAAFGTYYGPNDRAALAAWFLDADRAEPLLQQAVAAATIGGTGSRFGFGIGRTDAERIGALGFTGAQAADRFTHLRHLDPAFVETAGEGLAGAPDLSAEKQGISAEFGLDGASAQQIQRRLDERSAAFAGAGRAAVSQSGISGVDVANN